MNYIIGAGGVGSWLAHSLAKLIEPDQITIVDGDTLESKNLDRQLFSESDIGTSKAKALGKRLSTKFIESYYALGLINMGRKDTILCCVDNHPGRLECLKTCDMIGVTAYFGSNETLSSEAFTYRREWKETLKDPRVYYPDIVDNKDNDPRRIAIGCTGEVQKANRQLVSANFMAAALMQHLFVLWELEMPKMDKSAHSFLPHRSSVTLTKMGVIREVDIAELERT